MYTLEALEIRVLTSSAWSCLWRHPGWVHRRDSGLSVLYDIWLWHKLRVQKGSKALIMIFLVFKFQPSVLGSEVLSLPFWDRKQQGSLSKRKHSGLEILSFGYIWGARQIH